MTIDFHRERLLAEREKLLGELGLIGKPERGNPENWQATADLSEDIQFHDEVADRLEDFNERTAATNIMEQRLRRVDLALEKIATGTFGHCEVCQEAIEPERLEANSAARTCKAHIAKEDLLL